MIPNAGEIVRRRWTVQIVLRLCAIVLLFSATYPLISWMSEGLADGDLWNLTYYASRVVLAILLGLFGALLFVMSGLLTRWLVPIRRDIRCPACRHRIEGMTEPMCTECGLLLTREFLEPLSNHSPVRERRAVRVLRYRETVRAVFRVGGVFSALFGLLWGAGTLVSVVYWYRTGRFDEYSYYGAINLLGAFLQTLVWLGFSAAMLFKAEQLAAFCVPYRAGDHAPEATDPAE